MKRISYKSLPKKAVAAIPKNARTYLDEFEFRLYKDGRIAAYYAGDNVGLWDGKSWNAQFG